MSEIMDNDAKPMNTKELSEAVRLLLEREEVRDAQKRRLARRRVRHRREQMEASVTALTHSIEIIKWCIIGITTVMVLALIVLVMVVMEVEREAERIKSEVQHIQREAQLIRDKMQHPLQTLGGTLGRRLEGNLGIDNFFGGENSDRPAQSPEE